MTSGFDAIVIGAGHNGLVAANYLADAGRRVLVVEANAAVGGFTASSYAIPGAPEYLTHPYSFDPFFSILPARQRAPAGSARATARAGGPGLGLPRH
ncbi:MAG: FAD-dependent oxidoreductase [Sporichthyaceae bacterium]